MGGGLLSLGNSGCKGEDAKEVAFGERKWSVMAGVWRGSQGRRRWKGRLSHGLKGHQCRIQSSNFILETVENHFSVFSRGMMLSNMCFCVLERLL